MPGGRDLQVVALTRVPAFLARHQPHAVLQDLERRRPRASCSANCRAPRCQQRLLRRSARAGDEGQRRPTGGRRGRPLEQCGDSGSEVMYLRATVLGFYKSAYQAGPDWPAGTSDAWPARAGSPTRSSADSTAESSRAAAHHVCLHGLTAAPGCHRRVVGLTVEV